MSPTSAPTPCVEQGCFNLATVKGRCAQCQLIRGGARVTYDRQRGSARDRGYDRKWERRRKWHLEAEPFCRLCGVPGNQVDHVIPHRRCEWLFDLKGNLQTLCESHHTKKTMRERTIPIGMMYPLDLPSPPHAMTTKLLCGPASPYTLFLQDDTDLRWPDAEGARLVLGDIANLEARNLLLSQALRGDPDVGLVALTIAAPRTAERAFWSYVMDAPAELQEPPIEWVVDGHPKEWWGPYMLDGRAEIAIERRLG